MLGHTSHYDFRPPHLFFVQHAILTLTSSSFSDDLAVAPSFNVTSQTDLESIMNRVAEFQSLFVTRKAVKISMSRHSFYSLHHTVVYKSLFCCYVSVAKTKADTYTLSNVYKLFIPENFYFLCHCFLTCRDQWKECAE